MKLIKHHSLKLDDQYIEETFNLKNKLVEIRLNDRDYQRGDVIDYETSHGPQYARILHVLHHYGLKKGFVALSIKIISEKTFNKLIFYS